MCAMPLGDHRPIPIVLAPGSRRALVALAAAMTDRFRFGAEHGDLLGAHVSTRGGLLTAFDRGDGIEANAIALFTKNNSQWAAKPLTDEDCAAFADRRARSRNIPVLAHASYLINLAAVNPEFHRKAIDGLVDELQRCERLGIHALVLHPGAHMREGIAQGIDKIARALDEVHRRTHGLRVVTLLETSAGQGSCLGCSFEELAHMIELVDEKSRVGVCFDTCHVFASGYELRSREGYDRTMDAFVTAVGIENVGGFHLNDSKKPLGSRVDRHEQIGKGEIGAEPFHWLIDDERFRGIPKVIETPKSEPPDELAWDIENMNRLRRIEPRVGRRRARRITSRSASTR